MVNDIVADGLTRIRNSMLRKRADVVLIHNKITADVCQVLKDSGYIDGYSVEGTGSMKSIRVDLNYIEDDQKRIIRDVRRISKPGVRIYRGYKSLGKVLTGYGMKIVSTSKGVMSDSEARRQKTGGEIICEVY